MISELRGWPFLGDLALGGMEPGVPGFEEALQHAADREELLLQALRIAGVGGWELDIASNSLSWSEETYRIFGVAPAGEVRQVHSRAQVVSRGKHRTSRFLGVVQDVTERRLFEQSLERERAVARKLQADLIHISRVSAMGAMASALAHELNQPLASIANYATGLHKMAAKSGQAELMSGPIEAVRNNAVRAGEIIRRLRAMTTRGEIRKSRIEVAPCVAEAVDLALIGTGARARLDLTPGLFVDADRIQVQQVVINLVRNAVEAMEGVAEKQIVVASRPRKTLIELAVEDKGAGIAPELLHTIFDSFMSTKSEGMGVGLAISRTIVEAHGGRLTVRSKVGEGTTFMLTLPPARD